MRLAQAMGPRPLELIDWPVGSQAFARKALPEPQGALMKLMGLAPPEARQQRLSARRKGQALESGLPPAGPQRLDWPAARGPAP